MSQQQALYIEHIEELQARTREARTHQAWLAGVGPRDTLQRHP